MNAADDKEKGDSNIEKVKVLDNKKTTRCTSVTINNCNSSKNVESGNMSTSSKVVNGNSQHNEYCGKSFIDKTAVSISASRNGIGPHHIDCSKCSNGSTSSNGARPKVRTVCSLPNGVSEQSSTQKVNNNFVTTKFDKLHNGNGELNSMNIYLRNNENISLNVEKCPPKVRNNADNRGACGDDWNSSSENEGEDEEECCFYTYKGDCNQMADLPSSFFRLDTNAPRGNAGSRSSSPDMDYLEMDFDPGPSNDRDSPSISDSDGFDICTISRPTTPIPPVEDCEPQVLSEVEENTNNLDLDIVRISSSEPTSPLPEVSVYVGLPAHSPIAAEPSTSASTEIAGSSGDPNTLCGAMSLPLPVSIIESNLNFHKYNIPSLDLQCTMGKIINEDKKATLLDHEDVTLHSGDTTCIRSPMERVMLWSELEASRKQKNQISTSACGATAVVNVMLALNLSFSIDKIKEAVGVRMRRDTAPLPEYLFSRSVAGATHHDMIRGIETVSQGSLFARFFPMYPTRSFSLSHWLSYWMKRGAVPIATVNLQRGAYPVSQMPDWWHHQMIFGVGPKGIYLTNPLECINESSLMTLLCSPPVLLVRRKDVTDRWTPDTNLGPLMYHPNPAWKRFNVLGQAVNMIRESQKSSNPNCPSLTSHIIIPASYSSGITLVIPRESPGFYDLTVAPELPVLQINACSSVCFVTSNSVSGVTPNSPHGVYLKSAKLIIIDEISMTPSAPITVIDRLFRDLTSNTNLKNLPFAGKVVLFSGDFRQTLPVVPHAGRNVIIENCLKNNSLWPEIRKLRLEKNMRLKEGEEEFARFLLQVRNGSLPRTQDEMSILPNKLLGLGSPIDFVYKNVVESIKNEDIKSKGILAPKNSDCDHINNEVLSKLPGDPKTYVSENYTK